MLVYNKTRKLNVYSDDKGQFNIVGSKGDTLVFRHVSFKKRIVIHHEDANSSWIVVMKEKIILLETVEVNLRARMLKTLSSMSEKTQAGKMVEKNTVTMNRQAKEAMYDAVANQPRQSLGSKVKDVPTLGVTGVFRLLKQVKKKK